jgi:YVTN family beta-propeller protein
MHQESVRSVSRGFFPATVRFVVLALVVMLSAGVASAQTYAYVADRTDKVLVYDASTYAPITTVTVGSFPRYIAATPNQAFVYVTNRDSADVSVIATATNTVVATVPVGPDPRGLAVTPNGAFVYVANAGDSTISVIATASNTVVTTIQLATQPFSVTVAPNGAFAYVANTGGPSVDVIDTATNAVITSIPALFPTDVEITPNGAFGYVASASFFSGQVSVFSTASHTVVANLPIFALDLAITPDGASAYVVSSANIVVVATATNTVSATIPAGGFPQRISITPDGAFAWVSDGGGFIDIFDTTTHALLSTIVTTGQPHSVVFVVPAPPGPQDQIEALIDDIEALIAGGDLGQNQGAALINKLEQVLTKLDGGQIGAACNQLGSFINQVNAFINNGSLTQAEGQALIGAVNAIRTDLGC